MDAAIQAIQTQTGQRVLPKPVESPSKKDNSVQSSRKLNAPVCGTTDPADTFNQYSPQVTLSGIPLISDGSGEDSVSVDLKYNELCLGGSYGKFCVQSSGNCTDLGISGTVAELNDIVLRIHDVQGYGTIFGLPESGPATHRVLDNCTIDETGLSIPTSDYQTHLDALCAFAKASDTSGNDICSQLQIGVPGETPIEISSTTIIDNRKKINLGMQWLQENGHLTDLGGGAYLCPITDTTVIFPNLHTPSPTPAPAPTPAPTPFEQNDDNYRSTLDRFIDTIKNKDNEPFVIGSSVVIFLLLALTIFKCCCSRPGQTQAKASKAEKKTAKVIFKNLKAISESTKLDIAKEDKTKLNEAFDKLSSEFESLETSIKSGMRVYRANSLKNSIAKFHDNFFKDLLDKVSTAQTEGLIFSKDDYDALVNKSILAFEEKLESEGNITSTTSPITSKDRRRSSIGGESALSTLLSEGTGNKTKAGLSSAFKQKVSDGIDEVFTEFQNTLDQILPPNTENNLIQARIKAESDKLKTLFKEDATSHCDNIKHILMFQLQLSFDQIFGSLTLSDAFALKSQIIDKV